MTTSRAIVTPRRSSGTLARAPRTGTLFLVVALLAALFPFAAPLPSRPPRSAPLQPVDVEPVPVPARLLSTNPVAAPTTLAGEFVVDQAQGDGSRVAIVYPSPVNYRDDQGGWKPIDPRFEQVADGFVNMHNALQISAGQRRAAFRLRRGASELAWAPQALTLAGPHPTTLATPLDEAVAQPGALEADGRLIRYSQSWSLPGLAEELEAGPGQLEQRMVFAERPQGSGETLAFEALIQIPAGHTLYARGAPQSAAFQSPGPVELRDAAGALVLQFAPPRAFEQANPTRDAAGTYAFTPLDGGGWRIAVETPWSWWADPARAYPAVLDPTMMVLRATTRQLYQGAPCPDRWSIAGEPYQGEAVAIGRRPECDGVFRALIRFDNLPTMPPGYTVERASLAIVPARGYYAELRPPDQPPVRFPAIASVQIQPVRTHLSAEQFGQITWDTSLDLGPPIAEPRDLPFIFPPEYSLSNYDGRIWALQEGPTGLVSGWISSPASNNGLEIRMVDEQERCVPASEYAAAFCHFMEIPSTNIWTRGDISDLKSFDKLGLDFWTVTANGGFALLLTYTPPTLQDGVPLGYNVPIPLPTGGSDFSGTAHEYVLPASDAEWTAVGVKGLKEESGTILVGSREQPGPVLRVAGNFPLSVTSRERAGSSLVNALIHRGPMAPEHVLVEPPTSDDADRYVIETAHTAALSLPDADEFVYTSDTLVVSSTELLRIYSLPLRPNTRVRLALDLLQSFGPTGNSYFPQEGRDVSLMAFSPRDIGWLEPDAESRGTTGKMISVGSNEGGPWGVLVSFPGDVNKDISFYLYEGRSLGPVNISFRLKVVSCPLNAVPTNDGCAYTWKPPTYNNPGSGEETYKEVDHFRIYSLAGFGSGSQCPRATSIDEQCTLKAAPDGKPYLVYISWGNAWEESSTPNSPGRMVAVSGEQVQFNPRTGEIWVPRRGLNTFVNSTIWLALDPPDGWTLLQLWDGGLQIGSSDGTLVPDSQFDLRYSSLPLQTLDQARASMQINVIEQRAEGRATLTRSVEGAAEPLTFDLTWQVKAEGYTPAAAFVDDFTWSVTQTGGPDRAEVSSLINRFGSEWKLDVAYPDGNDGRFTNLRNAGKIVQPEELGGAWLPVQTLISPNDMPPQPGGSTNPADRCSGNCLQLRAASDTPIAPDLMWILPDVTVTGQANTVAMSIPGALSIYSTDNPAAAQGETVASAPFSFRSFGGEARVTREACPANPGAGIVTVVRVASTLVLPGIGSESDASAGVDADFLICQTALREVIIDANFPTPLPVGGPSSLALNMIGARVTIGPQNTQIEATIEYQASGGGVKGTATLTLNTEGLLDLQARGEMFAGIVDFEGHAWVAWEPLDVGLDLSARALGGLLMGQVHAHAWKGQGWQHRYSWLPDNDDFHLSGSIHAEITIPRGLLFGGVKAFGETIIPPLPPNPMSVGTFDIAFGQFCSNDACSSYEWGAKVVFGVFGFDVGAYYDFGDGDLDFILGSDDHKLIDQFASPAAAMVATAARDVPYAAAAAADPGAPTHSETFTVGEHTASFAVYTVWESSDAPTFTLTRPDGVRISEANAAANGITATRFDGPPGLLFGTKNPMPGDWTATIGNVTLATKFHFGYFANRAVPAVSALTPQVAEAVRQAAGAYRVSWSAPTQHPSDDHLRVSLYYTRTNTAALTATQQVSVGTIVEDLPIDAGGYDWDLSFLGSGVYQVYAIVRDGAINQPTKTALKQLPGYARTDAPGSITIRDSLQPAVPAQPQVTALPSGAMVCWAPNADHDLSGYVLRYTRHDVDGNLHQNALRVRATISSPPSPAWPRQECARIGGLGAGWDEQVAIQAYDATGNLSSTGPARTFRVPTEAPGLPVAPGTLSISTYSGTAIALSWLPTPDSQEPRPAGSGYLVHYAHEAADGLGQPGAATQGRSPVDVGNVTSTTLSGLDPGLRYWITVQAYEPQGLLSPHSNPVSVLLTSGRDDNRDGVPDDWAVAHRATEAGADNDGDTRANGEEFQRGTDPNDANSDGDLYSDGEEAACGSDPLDRRAFCVDERGLPGPRLPYLAVSPDALRFSTIAGRPDPAPQEVTISNLGGGTLTPSITADALWVALEPVDGGVRVSARSAGLSPGAHSATITIAGAPGSMTQHSPQHVTVELWITGEGLYQARQVGSRVYIERNIATAAMGDFDGDPQDGWALVGRTNGAADNGELRGYFLQDGIPYAIVFNRSHNKGDRCIVVTPRSLGRVRRGQTRLMTTVQDPAPCSGPIVIRPRPEVPVCYLQGAQSVANYVPGTRKNNTPVPANRRNPALALGLPQRDDTVNFVSLGFGGSLTLRFGNPIVNDGTNAPDLRVWETSFGDATRTWHSYPEAVVVYASADGAHWTQIGRTTDKDQAYDLALPQAQFLRLVDVSNRAHFGATDDGFDLDAIEVLSGCVAP